MIPSISSKCGISSHAIPLFPRSAYCDISEMWKGIAPENIHSIFMYKTKHSISLGFSTFLLAAMGFYTSRELLSKTVRCHYFLQQILRELGCGIKSTVQTHTYPGGQIFV